MHGFMFTRARNLRLAKARGMIIRARGIVPVKARAHEQSTGSKADQSTGYANQSMGYSAGQSTGLRTDLGILVTNARGMLITKHV